MTSVERLSGLLLGDLDQWRALVPAETDALTEGAAREGVHLLLAWQLRQRVELHRVRDEHWHAIRREPVEHPPHRLAGDPERAERERVLTPVIREQPAFDLFLSEDDLDLAEPLADQRTPRAHPTVPWYST